MATRAIGNPISLRHPDVSSGLQVVRDRKMLPSRSEFCLALLCCAVLYLLPYVLTLVKTGWTSLPPLMGVDQMLYLNLSAIQHAAPHKVANPWYGTSVSVADVPHLQFPITFIFFRFAHLLFRSLTLTMLIWAAVCSTLTFIAGIFCLRSLLPSAEHRSIVVAALGLMVLQSPLTYATGLMHLPSLVDLYQWHLPYLRFAIPQTMLPFALLYLGTQARLLEGGSKRLFVWMAALQFAVCISFPYFLPVLACGTAISFLIFQVRQENSRLSWMAIFAFGIACGLLDIGYLAVTGMGKSNGNVQFALQFRPELILPAVRPFVVVLVIASALAMVSRESLASRTTVAGMALANALFGFADVFFPPEAQILDHPHYIIALTTWLPLLVFSWQFLRDFRLKRLRTSAIGIVALLGLWEAFASFQSSLALNTTQAAAAAEIEQLSLDSGDLVVAPARFADDISSWIPLVTSAKVLYTPDGENILSADETRTQQAYRQAAYLEISGMDSATLSSVLTKDSSLNSFVEQGDRGYQRSHVEADRLQARSRILHRLSPFMQEFQSDPTSLAAFLTDYRRIVVIDDSRKPLFNTSTLSKWVSVERTLERNGIRIWIGRPRSLIKA